MKLTIELNREVDGRWIAGAPELNILLNGTRGRTPSKKRRQQHVRSCWTASLMLNCPEIQRTQRSTSPFESLARNESAACFRRPSAVIFRGHRTVDRQPTSHKRHARRSHWRALRASLPPMGPVMRRSVEAMPQLHPKVVHRHELHPASVRIAHLRTEGSVVGVNNSHRIPIHRCGSVARHAGAFGIHVLSIAFFGRLVHPQLRHHCPEPCRDKLLQVGVVSGRNDPGVGFAIWHRSLPLSQDRKIANCTDDHSSAALHGRSVRPH